MKEFTPRQEITLIMRTRLIHPALCTLVGVTTALSAPLSIAGPGASRVDPPQLAPPRLPPVESVTEIGTVGQNPVIYGRDGTASALIDGKSVWVFGDTALSVPGQYGRYWDDNSLSWTTDLNASDGIVLNHDALDRTGAPAEFLPYTREEAHYNSTHDPSHCTAQPCGAEFALWASYVVPDPDRNRMLVVYDEIWRVAGQEGWRSIGTGFAVGTLDGGMTRPIENPGSRTPTLMWSAGAEVGLDGGYVVVDSMLYSYGCLPGFFVQECRVGRVPLADALTKTAWTYYAGNGTWSPNQADAVIVFDGGAAGTSVFYVPYLDLYMAVYNGVFSNDVYYRVSQTPWGPWSDQALLFTGRPGWNNSIDYAGHAHPEFAEQDGRVQYVTYVHATGFFQSDLPLVRVVFGNP